MLENALALVLSRCHKFNWLFDQALKFLSTIFKQRSTFIKKRKVYPAFLYVAALDHKTTINGEQR